MDMVERVARIFDPKAWELVPKTPMDEKVINHSKHVACLKARAAIEAMREPTERMLYAATIIAPTWDDEVSRRKWRAMIEGAL